MDRRPALLELLLALVVAVLAPLGVVTATDLLGTDGGADGVETAGRGPGQGGRGDDALVVRPGEDDERPGSSTTVVLPSTTTTLAPSTTVPPTTTPSTTAPPTTAPPAPAPPPPPTAPPADSAATEIESVVALANMARAEAGCGELQVDERLTAAAQAHSDDMAQQGYFSHTSLDGRSLADRLSAAGYPSPGGENIAQGQRSALEVHDAWMGSEGHRANILNCDFTAVGVGLHAGTWTWTQDFGY
jgi:uncharacterized protein YkwD